jgi:hypothetical protein
MLRGSVISRWVEYSSVVSEVVAYIASRNIFFTVENVGWWIQNAASSFLLSFRYHVSSISIPYTYLGPCSLQS